MPDALREFTDGRDEAHALYGLDPATLTHLRDTGFPVSGCSGNARYDPYDLDNAALHLGQALHPAAGDGELAAHARRGLGPVACYQITWPTGTSRRLALESAQTFAGQAPDAKSGKEKVLLALATLRPPCPPMLQRLPEA